MAPRRSWEKANNPFSSTHVATWYRGQLEARGILPPAQTFDCGVRAVGAPFAKPGGSAQACGKLAEIARGRAGTEAKERPTKAAQETSGNRYSVRSDSGPIALRAFWSTHVEAMNWGGMGHAEYAAALGLSPHALRIWRDRLEESDDKMDWRSLLHPSARAQLSSAANCAQRKIPLDTNKRWTGGQTGVTSAVSKSRRSCRRRRSLRQRGAGLPPPWRRHQHGLPLAGRLWPDRSKGAATGNGGARQLAWKVQIHVNSRVTCSKRTLTHLYPSESCTTSRECTVVPYRVLCCCEDSLEPFPEQG